MLNVKLVLVSFIFISICSCQKYYSSQFHREVFCVNKSSIEKASRSRTLKKMKRNLAGFDIEKWIKERIFKNKNTEVFEFGMGHGRAILEIASLFPQIKTWGLNKNKGYYTCNTETLAQTAIDYGFYDKVENVNFSSLPTVIVKDVSDGLLSSISDNKFDLIISQVAVQYILRKDILMNEFLRVLKPNAKAVFTMYALSFLDMDGREISYKQAILKLKEKKFPMEYQKVDEFPPRHVLTLTKKGKNHIMPVKFIPEQSGTRVQFGGVKTVLQFQY